MRVSAGRATRLALPAFLQVYLFFTGMSTYSIIVSSQDRIRCTDGNFCAVTGGEGEHKFGIRNMDGTASYFKDGLLYVKRNRNADPSGKYENNAGLTFPLMLYYNGIFTEIEPNSVMYNIPAGESVTETLRENL